VKALGRGFSGAPFKTFTIRFRTAMEGGIHLSGHRESEVSKCTIFFWVNKNLLRQTQRIRRGKGNPKGNLQLHLRPNKRGHNTSKNKTNQHNKTKQGALSIMEDIF
jgi:hypothetical protein